MTQSILFLGNENNSIIDFLKDKYSVTLCTEKIDVDYVKKFDFVISYGYRHIIKKNVIDASKNGIINLHISYLPWNRGADPNFWSFVDKTKKGVTIHFIDEGIDTGDIILQKEVNFCSQKTLAETYNKLSNEIEDLFIRNWKNISSGSCKRKKQPAGGSFHLAKEFKKYNLENGWDTRVDNLHNIVMEDE